VSVGRGLEAALPGAVAKKIRLDRKLTVKNETEELLFRFRGWPPGRLLDQVLLDEPASSMLCFIFVDPAMRPCFMQGF